MVSEMARRGRRLCLLLLAGSEWERPPGRPKLGWAAAAELTKLWPGKARKASAGRDKVESGRGG